MQRLQRFAPSVGSMASILAGLFITSVTGCTGEVGTPSGGGVGGPGGGPGGGGSGGMMPPVGGMAAEVPGRAPLRRLSRAEFNATVAALLGDTTQPANGFEPDVISDGFTNNADTQNVSTNLAQQYLVAAETLSANATRDLPKLLGCDPAAQATCLRTFVTSFGQKAWRRPLASAEIDRVMGVLDTGRMQFDVTTGVQMALQTLLLSPNFLYRVEFGAPPASASSATVALTSWEMASRLSYFLMGSMPDDQLFAAAAKDELRTTAQIADQVKRILSPGAATTLPQQQAQSHYAQFFTEWLHLNYIDKATKDTSVYPDFTSDLALSMRTETESFVKATLFGGAGDLPTLLSAPYTYGSADIAKVYGAPAPAGAAGAINRIDLDPKQRAGLLTEPSLMSTFAKSNGTDPVHRGKFVWESILCKSIPAPPADAKINPPTITPGTTARQRYTQHRTDPTCASCHKVMDPIGLAFEHYDGMGKWRDKEGTLDIDVSGELNGTDVDGTFNGAVELAQKLAGSHDVAGCAVRQLFRFAFGRFESAEDEPTISNLADSFVGSKKQMVGLAVAVTQTPAFQQLTVRH